MALATLVQWQPLQSKVFPWDVKLSSFPLSPGPAVEGGGIKGDMS